MSPFDPPGNIRKPCFFLYVNKIGKLLENTKPTNC